MLGVFRCWLAKDVTSSGVPNKHCAMVHPGKLEWNLKMDEN